MDPRSHLEISCIEWDNLDTPLLSRTRSSPTRGSLSP